MSDGDNGKIHKKVLVCGGREFSNADLVNDTLNRLANEYTIECIIEGNAPGADRLAGNWARINFVPSFKYPADWERYGRYAGPKRNKRMIVEARPDLVVAFPGGTGTADMVNKAKSAGIEVIEIAC